ncbi:hypothetical protein PVAP13_9KG535078 [Panicum virgatum]|uniref:Uncharacterized protein n=1 Tax=Panicum virgatum TaxID=38727 RepID=A0A8T0NYM2_PANVG|nr:hypothetical protein PVAP13_9KG535078 [Panicum virgatum]
MAKLPDRFMLVLASGGGAICAWGLGIDFGGARWGPHAESHVGARAMVLPSSSAWRAHASAKRQSPARDGCGECGGAWSRVAVVVISAWLRKCEAAAAALGRADPRPDGRGCAAAARYHLSETKRERIEEAVVVDFFFLRRSCALFFDKHSSVFSSSLSFDRRRLRDVNVRLPFRVSA